jgi:P27 family predicted phage terminase small subunit
LRRFPEKPSLASWHERAQYLDGNDVRTRGILMSGPPPVPTNLRILRGNPSKRPLRPELMPDVPQELPEAPAFLLPAAKAEWERIAVELYRLKLLTTLDVNVLAAYCQSYARWRAAEEELAKMVDTPTGGLLIRSADGPRVNPLVRIARDAGAAMVAYASQFGLGPAARARVAAGVAWREGISKFDGLLGPPGGRGKAD